MNNAVHIVDTQEMTTVCYWHILSYQCYLNFPNICSVFFIFTWDILQLRQVIPKLPYVKQMKFSFLVSTFRMPYLVEMHEI